MSNFLAAGITYICGSGSYHSIYKYSYIYFNPFTIVYFHVPLFLPINVLSSLLSFNFILSLLTYSVNITSFSLQDLMLSVSYILIIANINYCS